jgi:hypothetical protein
MDAVEGISGALANSPNSQEYPRMLVRSTNSAPNKGEMDSARRAERSYSYIRVLSNNEASKPERQIPHQSCPPSVRGGSMLNGHASSGHSQIV